MDTKAFKAIQWNCPSKDSNNVIKNCLYVKRQQCSTLAQPMRNTDEMGLNIFLASSSVYDSKDKESKHDLLVLPVWEQAWQSLYRHETLSFHYLFFPALIKTSLSLSAWWPGSPVCPVCHFRAGSLPDGCLHSQGCFVGAKQFVRLKPDILKSLMMRRVGLEALKYKWKWRVRPKVIFICCWKLKKNLLWMSISADSSQAWLSNTKSGLDKSQILSY